MKKAIKLLTVASMSLLLLTACDGFSDGSIVKGGGFKAVGDKGDYYDILKDLETGCLYLESHYQTGLMPYYGEDGEVQGCGETESLPKYK